MFGKRFHLVTVQGISIGVDFSWFFIAILLTWSLAAGYFPAYYPGFEGGIYLLMGLVGMLGLFISVVLHELGHALTAKWHAVPISRITLFIFGGIAELKEDPPNAKSEFAVAIAGPIVSVALYFLFGSLANLGDAQQWPLYFVAVVSYLSVINLIIVIFNLIPAFPLDGGRVLRAFLWWKSASLGWATRISSNMGSGFGFVLIFLGLLMLLSGNLMTGLWWMILGLFLQQAATMARRQYYIKRELQGEKVEKYTIKEPHTVPPHITIHDFIDNYVYKTYHHLYPVVEEGGKLLGYITLEQIKGISKDEFDKKTVRDLLVPLKKAITVSPQTEVLEAFGLFKDSPTDSLLVTDKGLIGLLRARDLSKVISMKIELDESIH